ncbi:MAG: phospholipase D-like domain-containing protein, partial [Elusimicrobiota bacterium]
MKTIRVISLITLELLLLNARLLSQKTHETINIEIVESYPTETSLDHQDIRDTKNAWIEMLQKAKKTIDIAQFYITSEKNEPMEEIISEIKSAAKRGVNIRIITDSGFYKKYPSNVDDLSGNKGITVNKIDLKGLTGGVMHAKYFIVDSEETFLGSQNFDWRSLKHIQEIGVRVKSKEFSEKVLKIFNIDWEISSSGILPKINTAETPDKSGNFISLSNDLRIKPVVSPPSFSPSDLSGELDEIVNLIEAAEKDVLIQVMNYSPKAYNECDLTIDNAIRNAAGNGKKIKLLVSDWSLKYPHINYLKSLSIIPNIEVKILSIPRYSQKYIPFARVIHSKFVISDDKIFYIGSSNFEPGYFKKSRNLGIIVQNTEMAKKLRQVFFDSWTSNYSSYIEL